MAADPQLRTQLSYSLFYFAFYAGVSVILAFFPIHCRNIGFDNWQIAMLSAAANVAGILGGPALLHLAHFRLAARNLLLASSLASAAMLMPLLWLADFGSFLCVWLMAMLGNSGAVALVDANAVRESGEGRVRFERVRVWGSFGFICMAFASGLLVDSLGEGAIIPVLLACFCGTFAGALVVSRRLHAQPARTKTPDGGAPGQLVGTGFYKLAAVSGLIWASHSVLYVYLSLYLEALGWSAKWISLAWNVGVISEICFFFCLVRIERRFSYVQILRISVAATVLRWTLYMLSENWLVILLAQSMHALTFAGVYISTMRLVYLSLPPDLKDRGQGYLTSLGAGLGSLLGRLLAGFGATLVASSRELGSIFALSVILAALAFLISLGIPSDVEKRLGGR